jgi:ATP-dependent Clp protease adaptor protein ClpS
MHPESPEIGLVCPGAGQNPGLAWLGDGLYDGAKAARVWRGVLRFWNASCLGKAMTSTVRKSSPADRAAAAPGGDRPPRMADDDRKRKGEPGGPSTAVITKTKPQTKRPSLYRVLILNDDYTPMEFVVHVLERFFGKDHEAATRIMLHVHHHGIGECGIYTYEVAETKVTQVMDFARKHQHPLQCVMEKK